jgi:hypothetical protein
MKVPMAYLLCAWVLWGAVLNSFLDPGKIDPDKLLIWSVREAFETKQDCDAALKRVSGSKPPTGLLKCLPDTVDPRSKSN